MPKERTDSFLQSRKNYVSDNISLIFVLKICAVGNKIKRIFFTVQFNIVARSHNERSYYIAAYRRYTAKSLAARSAYNVQKHGFGTVIKIVCRCDFAFSPAVFLKHSYLFRLPHSSSLSPVFLHSSGMSKRNTVNFIPRLLQNRNKIFHLAKPLRRVYHGLREQLRLQAKANP